MDWNARFEEACSLMESDHTVEAAEIFEEVAEATSHPKALRMAILSKLAMFWIDESVLYNSNGEGFISYLDVAEETQKSANKKSSRF